MSHLEPPPQSSANFPPETEIPGPSTYRADCNPCSTGVQPEDRHAKVMENFKRMIFKFAIASSPTKLLSPVQRFLIEQRLDEFFSSFRTPDHPPYSAMIEAAMQNLDEEGASSDEAIFQVIRREYSNLPWAHDILFKHHLENLCENGSIVRASNGLYMLSHVVTRHDSAPSPCSSFGPDSSLSLSPSCSSSSSSSWSSSSYCSSPRIRRKRIVNTKRRKKQGRQRGRKKKRRNRRKVNSMRCAQVPKRRQRRPAKKDVLEDEAETNAEHLMLEEKCKETEAQNKSKEECNKGAESIKQIRGRQPKVRKQGQPAQGSRLVIDIRLDKHEYKVDEEQRDQQAQVLFIRDYSQALEIENQTQEYHEEAKEEQLCQVMEQTQTKVITGLQQEDEAEEGGEEAFLMEGRREVAVQEGWQLIEEESLLKKTNFQVIKEQSQVEGHDIVSEQDHRKTHKRKARLQNRGVKGKEAPLMPTCIQGRRRGRPCKKFLLAGKIQQHVEQMKPDIQDPMLEERTEVPEEKYKSNKEFAGVVEDHDQLQGYMHEIHECSRAVEAHVISEIGKSGSVGEVNKLIKQQQKDESVEECDEQKEHENFEGIEEPRELEEHNMVPEQDQIGKKRKGRPLKRDVKRRKDHLKPTRIPGRGRGRLRKKDLATGIQDPMSEEKTEVPDQEYKISKQLTEVVEKHSQSLGKMHESLEGSPAEEAEMVKEIRQFGPVLEENRLVEQWNLIMEVEPQIDEAVKGFEAQKEHKNFLGSEEKIQFGEPDMVPKQVQRNVQKRRGQLLSRGAKGRKVHLKHSRLPGRAMGGPRKKYYLVKRTQVNAEQMVTTDIDDPMLEENTEENCQINKECTEMVEECSELKGHICMHGTSEWSQAEETKMVKEVKKLGQVAEENIPIKQHISMMEGEHQKDWGAKGLNEQKEHEDAFDEHQNQFAREKNEMTFGENQPKGQENKKQNQQLEKHSELVTQKVELPEHGQTTRIQESIRSEGQYESVTETWLSVDVAKRSMEFNAIVFPKESFGLMLEDGKEISNRGMKQPGEEKVLEIGRGQREVIEQNLDSSTAGKFQWKTVERSSQPHCSQQQQPQHAEEKLQDGQLCSYSLKSFGSCGML